MGMKEYGSRFALVILLTTTFATTPLYAETVCTQDRAIYSDRDDHYRLSFMKMPTHSKASPQVATSNEFVITRKDSPVSGNAFKLNGVVYENGNPSVDIIMHDSGLTEEEGSASIGSITYQCPVEDVTSEKLEECTVWQGMIYALKEGADATLLPKAQEPAAQALLFPYFVTSLNAFDFGDAKLTEPLTWEVFRFKECADEKSGVKTNE